MASVHEPICETLGCFNDATMFDVTALAFFCQGHEPTGDTSMPEQATIYREEGSVTIIATMVPVSAEEQEARVTDTALLHCGLQLIEKEAAE